jgi:hypothetical protein
MDFGDDHSECKQYLQLREALADYMATADDGEPVYPPDRLVVDVMDAAGGATEEEVIRCLRYLRDERGLRPGDKHGPRRFAWFKTVVGDYFRRKNFREAIFTPPNADDQKNGAGLRHGGEETSASSVPANRENRTSPASASAPLANWPIGGWENAEDFEIWWTRIVRDHPNKSRNGVARTMAIELVMTGTLQRTEFESGYAALRRANEQRWAKEHGRCAPNLWQLLDDQAWKYEPDAGAPKPEYPSADDYLRRIQAE